MNTSTAAEIVERYDEYEEEKNSYGLTHSEAKLLKTNYHTNLKGYILKNQEKLSSIYEDKSNLNGALKTVKEYYTLLPEPLHQDGVNENIYIVLAKQTHNLDYVFFFLHFYEKKLNSRIEELIGPRTPFLTKIGQIAEAKIQCREYIFKKFLYFDETRGVEFTTYIYDGIHGAILKSLKSWSDYGFSSVDDYADFRRMAYLIDKENTYNNGAFVKYIGAVRLFAVQNKCSKERAMNIAKSVLENKQRVFEYEYEDGERVDIFQEYADPDPDRWKKHNYIYGDISAAEVYKAFKKLSYKEQRVVEKRIAACLKCKRVSETATKESFEDIAVDFELKSPKSAEKIYRNAIDKMSRILIENDILDGAEIELLSRNGYGAKTKSATYKFRPYYPKKPYDWGTIEFNFETGKVNINKPFLFDAYETEVVKYIHSISIANIPKTAMVVFV